VRPRNRLGQVTSGRITPAKVKSFRQDHKPTTLGRSLPDGVNRTVEVSLGTAWLSHGLSHANKEFRHVWS
jgi:hypothetical protein